MTNGGAEFGGRLFSFYCPSLGFFTRRYKLVCFNPSNLMLIHDMFFFQSFLSCLDTCWVLVEDGSNHFSESFKKSRKQALPHVSHLDGSQELPR